MASSKKSYSQEQIDAVLADVPSLGVCGAASKHVIPNACVSRWADKAGVKRLTRPSRVPKAAVTPAAPTAAVSAPVVAQHEEVSPSKGSSRRSLKSRVALHYTPSQKAEILEFASVQGASAAAERFGVSRFSIYEWHRQSIKAANGQGPSPTCGPAPKEIEQQRDKEVLDEWHKHPGLGPSQIVNQLRRRNVKVGVNTARRIMESDGYRPPKVQREPHEKRFEAIRPNHLWHLDFVQRHINRTTTFSLILIDDYSRYVVGHGIDDAERAELVIETFEQATTRHGRPEKIMNDKGSAFWSWKGISRFTALLTEMGIDQVVAEHKEWNGKIEVFNGNLHKELFDQHRFYDISDMRKRLQSHLHWYNHARTHHALGGLLVPADRYYGRVDEVLSRIEAGAGRDAGEWLDLRERCLELFKVTSRAGVPEVFLLGHKLLGGPLPPSSAG